MHEARFELGYAYVQNERKPHHISLIYSLILMKCSGNVRGKVFVM